MMATLGTVLNVNYPAKICPIQLGCLQTVPSLHATATLDMFGVKLAARGSVQSTRILLGQIPHIVSVLVVLLGVRTVFVE